MYSASIRHMFSLFFACLALFQMPCLEAGGYGKTNETFQFEGTVWNGVYFDMNGLSFIASIPNYAGASLQNGDATLKGNVGEAWYVINASLNGVFNPPKTLKEFIKLIQDANPKHTVVAASSNSGAKYAVDLNPRDPKGISCRFLCTNNRLIQMATVDTNVQRRLKFFDSIGIR